MLVNLRRHLGLDKSSLNAETFEKFELIMEEAVIFMHALTKKKIKILIYDLKR